MLVAPAGLRVPGVEVDDLFRIPPEELVGRLVHRIETLQPHLPADPHDVDFIVDRYRELRTTALMLWEHPFDRVVPRWLGRVDVPSLVVWGEEDACCRRRWRRRGRRCCPTPRWRRSPMPATSSSTSRPRRVAAVARFCAAG